MIESISGKTMLYEYVEKNREGDHICYISNLAKMKSHYPKWTITKSLNTIFVEIHRAWLKEPWLMARVLRLENQGRE